MSDAPTRSTDATTVLDAPGTGDLPDVGGADGEPDHDGLTLDDLAERCSLPSRTVRFYRQNGLLPPPQRVGRRAFYRRADLDRLRAICELRDRGLGLDAIASILDDPDGEHVTAIVRVADQLRQPWSQDRAADMTRSQIVDTLGTERAHSIDNLVAFGIIVPIGDEGHERYHVPSVTTLELAGDLKIAGLGVTFMYEAWQAMERHLSALACELVALHAQRNGSEDEMPPADLRQGYTDMRAVALRAVQHFFAQAVDRALNDYVAAAASRER